MSSGASATTIRRDLGLALLAREELLAAVDRAVAALPSVDDGPIARVRSELASQAQRARGEVDVDVGLPVSMVARRFGLAEPTIRSWVDAGLLGQVPERSPLEVTVLSIVRAERLFGEVRDAYPPREWTRLLAARLHDENLMGQEWAREGLAARDRGDTVEL